MWGKECKEHGCWFARFCPYFGLGDGNVLRNIKSTVGVRAQVYCSAAAAAKWQPTVASVPAPVASTDSIFLKWLLNMELESFIVRWYHVYQCLLRVHELNYPNLFSTTFQCELSSLSVLGFSLFSKAHAHSCFYTFASCCCPSCWHYSSSHRGAWDMEGE